MDNQLWNEATSKNSLEVGWHLARAELSAGFFHDYFHLQAFAHNLAPQLKEVKRLLDTQTYRTKPLREVLVPKGPFSTRPGSHLPIRDRVVFWAIVRTIAPIYEKHMHKEVYSYRLKDNPKQGELFKEGDVLQIPFLKRKDIGEHV
jgi:hypothetical protein